MKQKQKQNETVIAYDFDMLGCIFNPAYLDYKEREARGELTSKEKSQVSLFHPVTLFNRVLRDTILEEIDAKNPSGVLILNGSHQQDWEEDHSNMTVQGHPVDSVYSALVELRSMVEASTLGPTRIKITLDNYWLADSYNDRLPGTSFKKRQEALKQEALEKSKHPKNTTPVTLGSKPEKENPNTVGGDYRSIHDATKITILYAHMHRLSVANPEKEIIFNFYDDATEILGGLSRFFRKNPTLVPYNVRLRLHHYAGDNRIDLEKQNAKSCITLVDEIQGTGIADYDYANSLKSIVKLAGYEGDLTKLSDPDDLTHENIRNFPVDKFIKERAERLSAINHEEAQACKVAFNSWPDRCVLFLSEAIFSFANTGKASANIPEKGAFSRDLDALFRVLQEDIEKQQNFKIPTEQILESTAITICRATRTMLDALAGLPKGAPLEQKIAILKTYETACRDTSGWMTFAKFIGAAVISALIFLIMSGGLMGVGSGVHIFENIIAGWKDILDHDMTSAATQLITSAVVGTFVGGCAGASALFRFFKPSVTAEKVSAVMASAVEGKLPQGAADVDGDSIPVRDYLNGGNDDSDSGPSITL